jgi:hypothetical protein
MDTPNAYARQLATYIASPTKIQALTRLEFDRVPPLRKIADWRFEVEQKARRFKLMASVGLEEVAEPEVRTYAKGGTVYVPARVELPAAELPSITGVRCHRDIVAAVAMGFGLTYAETIGQARGTQHVCARAVAARILRERGNSFPQIGRYLGDRDHSTIINLLSKYEARIAKHPQMGVVYEQLTAPVVAV